jgi:hypothetical protein
MKKSIVIALATIAIAAMALMAVPALAADNPITTQTVTTMGCDGRNGNSEPLCANNQTAAYQPAACPAADEGGCTGPATCPAVAPGEVCNPAACPSVSDTDAVCGTTACQTVSADERPCGVVDNSTPGVPHSNGMMGGTARGCER